MKKILLTASVHYHFTAFHFPLIDLLHKNGYEVHVAAKSYPEKVALECLTDRIEAFHETDFDRSPLSLKNISAYKALKKLIDDGGYDAVHCNTPVVGILTRLAARKARKRGTKVIYTAHGFHFYKGASKLNWLVFYPLELIIGRLFTDCLITIGDEDEKRARKNKLCKSIFRIHGVGVDGEKFHEISFSEKLELRREYGYNERDVLCLCTGELNLNKNQKLFIAAMEHVKACPGLKLIFAGAGDSLSDLQAQIKGLHLEDRAQLLGYRTDVADLLKISDFVCSASYREGLPVNIIEGMFSSKPAIVSHNRGHDELVADNESGIFVPTDDPQAAARALERLCKDKDLREKMGRKAFERAQKYSTLNVAKELEEIYKKAVFDCTK